MNGRALTSGEIALAKRVFKDSINYTKVKIHNKKYVVVQPYNSGMTPNGEIYISGSEIYKNDYAMESIRLRGFFIHEMVHVWQYQLNILNPVSAAIAESILNFFDYSKAYEYELVGGKDLLQYRIEIYKPLSKGRYTAVAGIAMVKNGKIVDSKQVVTGFTIE